MALPSFKPQKPPKNKTEKIVSHSIFSIIVNFGKYLFLGMIFVNSLYKSNFYRDCLTRWIWQKLGSFDRGAEVFLEKSAIPHPLRAL